VSIDLKHEVNLFGFVLSKMKMIIVAKMRF